DPVPRVALADEDVVEVGSHRRGDIRRHRPGPGRPDEEPRTQTIHEREAHGQARVLAILVALVHLHLAHPGAASRAPGHRIDALVEQAAPVYTYRSRVRASRDGGPRRGSPR